MKNQASYQEINTLRGGGCGQSNTRENQKRAEQRSKINKEQLPASLLSKTQAKVKSLKSKTLTIGDKAVQDEYFNTINWLDVNEYWYQMIPDHKQKITQSIQLISLILQDILEIVEQIIDGSRFIAYSLIRVSNNFSRIMVIYYTHNPNTSLDKALSDNLKELINNIKKIIKGFGETSIYYNGLQYESGITEACINICPVDNPEGKELGLNALKEIVMSAISMSPSDDLFTSLKDLAIFGLKALLQKYKEMNFKEMMTKCLFIEQLRWSVVKSIQQQKFSIKQIFNSLGKFYKNEIKHSKTWEVKYCWIKASHWIMGYRLIITKDICNHLQINDFNQHWFQLIQQEIIQFIDKQDDYMGAILDENQLQMTELNNNNPIYLKLIVQAKLLNRIKDKLLNGSEILPKILQYHEEFALSNQEKQGEVNKQILQVQKEFSYFEIGQILGNLNQIQTLIIHILINLNDLNELRIHFNQQIVDQDLANDISQLGGVILQQAQELQQLFIKTRINVLQCGLAVDNFITIINSDYPLKQQYEQSKQVLSLQRLLSQLDAVVNDYYTSESSDQLENSQYKDIILTHIQDILSIIKSYQNQDSQKIIQIQEKLNKLINNKDIIPEQIKEIQLISDKLVNDSIKNSTYLDIIQLAAVLENCQTFIGGLNNCIYQLQEMTIDYAKIKFIKFQFINETTDYQRILHIKIQSCSWLCSFNNIQKIFQKILNKNVTLSQISSFFNKNSQTLQPTSDQNKSLLSTIAKLEWTMIENYSLIVQNKKIEVQEQEQLQRIDGTIQLQTFLIQQQERMAVDFQYLLQNIKYIDRANQDQQKSNDLLSNLKLTLQETQMKLQDIKSQQKQFIDMNGENFDKLKTILQSISTKDEQEQLQYSKWLNELKIKQWNIHMMNAELLKQIDNKINEPADQQLEINQDNQKALKNDLADQQSDNQGKNPLPDQENQDRKEQSENSFEEINDERIFSMNKQQSEDNLKQEILMNSKDLKVQNDPQQQREYVCNEQIHNEELANIRKRSFTLADKNQITQLHLDIKNVIQTIDFNIESNNIQQIENIITQEYLDNIQYGSLSQRMLKQLTSQFKQFNSTNSKNFMQINLISDEMKQNLNYIRQHSKQQVANLQIDSGQSNLAQKDNKTDQVEEKNLVNEFLKLKQNYINHSSQLLDILKWYNNYDDSNWRTLSSFKFNNIDFLLNQLQSTFNQLINMEFSRQFINYQQIVYKQPINISYEQVKQCLEQNQENVLNRESNINIANDEWRFRECQIFNILIIQFNLMPNPQQEYNKQLIIHKAIETDNRLQKIFQSSDFILQQQQALEKHWKQQSSSIQLLIARQLLKLQQLQKSIQSQQPGSDRDSLLLEHESLEAQIDHQIENVSNIGNSLGITIVFIKDLKKELQVIQDSLKDLTSKLNDIGQDIKFLIGKSPQQLLELRMDKVLKQKTIDDARTVYVQLYTLEMEDLKNGHEAKLPTPLNNGDEEQNGEIDEFIEHKTQTSLLVHGPAGSGKSTAAKKVEEYLWIRYKKQQIRNWKENKGKIIVPIFIQLPSLKDPKFNALQETLKSSEYQFNEKQILDLQEDVQNGRIQLFIIMDSYDELSREYLEQNLNITNKYEQWCEHSNYKILNTTRSEILLGKTEYRKWFSSTMKEISTHNFKEIRILPFNEKQRFIFFDQFCKLSLKQVLIDIYDILLDQRGVKIDTALVIRGLWEQIRSCLSNSNIKQEYLLDAQQIDDIIQKIEAQKDNKIDLSKDQKAHLAQQLSQLWSKQMYVHNINQLSIMDLVKTPYMTNIVVSVLPKLIEEFSSQDHLKPVFLRNIRFRLEEQQSLNLYQELESDFLQNWKLLINQADVKTESQITSQVSIEIWNVLIESKSLVNYKITNINIQSQIYSKLLQELRSIAQKNREQNLNDDLNSIYDNLLNIALQVENLKQLQQSKVQLQQLNDQCDLFTDSYSKKLLQVLKDYDLIFDSIAQNKPSSYDFYKMFISEFITKQIQKLSYKQQNVQVHKFIQDSHEYAQTLGTLMTQYELTSIEYLQKGIIDKKCEDGFQQMLGQLFDDNANNSQLKAQIRTSIPLKVRGNQYSFYHKSIQEYLFAKSFLDLLDYMQLIQDLQIEQLFIYRKQQEYVEFPYKNENSYEDFRRLNKLKRDKVKRIIQYLEYLNVHHINLKNYSEEFFIGAINFIVNKIQYDPELLKITMILLKISKLDKSFQICTLNCLHILIKAQISFVGQDLSGIIASNISIQGVVFKEVDLSYSCFNKVNINGINLVSANLSHCQWQKLTTNELPVIKVGQPVNSIAYSTNSQFIVSGSEDGKIRVWDSQSGKQFGDTLIGHDSEVTTVTYSPDGELIASGSSDNTIRIWNAQSCEQIGDPLVGHINGVLSIVFSPDGKFIASGSKDNTFRIWDTQSHNQINHLRIEHTYLVLSISPNGKFIVLGSEDGTIRIWNAQSGKQFGATLTGHTKKITSLAYSPDAQFIASGSYDETIRIWNIQTGKQIGDTLIGHSHLVQSLAYSPDGKFIASGSEDNTIMIWDSQSGKQFGETLTGHIDRVTTIAYSPDGKLIASGGRDRIVRIWDAQSGKQIGNTVPGHTNEVRSVVSSSLYSPDGKFIASGAYDNTIRIWDTQTCKQIGETLTGHTEYVNSVVYSPDGNYIASGSDDGTVRIWDAQSGIQIGDSLCDHSSSVFEEDGEMESMHSKKISCVMAVAYSPDGRFIASGHSDKVVRIWDTQSHKQFGGALTGHTAEVISVAYSPDGKLIASGSECDTVKIWDAQTCIQILETDPIYVNSVAFSPDSKFIVTGGQDYLVRILDVQSGKQIGDALVGHTRWVSSVAYSADGKFIASGSDDKTVRIWDAQSYMKSQYIQEEQEEQNSNELNDLNVSKEQQAIELKHNRCQLRIPNIGPILYDKCMVHESKIISRHGIDVIQLWKHE